MHLSEIAALLTQPKVVKVARSARTKIKHGIGVTLRWESKASLMCGVLYLSVVKNGALSSTWNQQLNRGELQFCC